MNDLQLKPKKKNEKKLGDSDGHDRSDLGITRMCRG